jgi:cell division initiation protein
MRLAPIDIVNKKFSRAIRGLHPSEVADFQTEAAATMEELVLENAHLRESVEALNQQVAKYARIEETLQNTLFLAQKAAEEAHRTAKHEAELTLREAQQQAHLLLEQAQARVREVDAEVAHARRERDRFAAEFGALLQGYLTGLGRTGEWASGRRGDGATDRTELEDGALARKDEACQTAPSPRHPVAPSPPAPSPTAAALS